MSPEERALNLSKLDRALSTRALYRGVYGKDEAVITVAQMMDDAGYYSTNPDTVNPELVAQVNRLLSSIGSVHPQNTFLFAKAIIGIANDDDLTGQRAAIVAAEED